MNRRGITALLWLYTACLIIGAAIGLAVLHA
jgi:hypothetical protein